MGKKTKKKKTRADLYGTTPAALMERVRRAQKEAMALRWSYAGLFDDLCEYDIVIPEGEYRGRRGKITEAMISEGGRILAICRPYNLRYPRQLLWTRPDARSFWPVDGATLLRRSR